MMNFHLTAPRAIRRFRFGQGFHHSPALCAAVKRLLVLFKAFILLGDIVTGKENVSSE